MYLLLVVGELRHHVGVTRLEVVLLLRLPGQRRALVDAETAELGERMGELRRLDGEQDPQPQPVRPPAQAGRV